MLVSTRRNAFEALVLGDLVGVHVGHEYFDLQIRLELAPLMEIVKQSVIEHSTFSYFGKKP